MRAALVWKFVRWLLGSAVLLLLIVGALFAYEKVREQIDEYRALPGQMRDLEDLSRSIADHRKSAEKDLLERMQRTARQIEAGLDHRAAESESEWDRRIAKIEAELDRRIAEIDAQFQKRNEEIKLASPFPVFPLGEAATRVFKAHVEVELLRQEAGYLRRVKSIVRQAAEIIRTSKENKRLLEQLRGRHVEAYAALTKNRSDQAALKWRSPSMCEIPLTECNQKWRELQQKETVLLVRNKDAYDAYMRQLEVVNQDDEKIRTSKENKRLLEQLRGRHVEAYAALTKNRDDQAALKRRSPSMCKIPLTECSRELWRHQQEELILAERNKEAHEAYMRQLAVVNRPPQSLDIPSFGIDPTRLNELEKLVSIEIAKRAERLGQNWVSVVYAKGARLLPAAAGILLAILVAPVAIKAMMYFLIAPVASRLAPISLVPHLSGELRFFDRQSRERTSLDPVSTTSRSITIRPTEELVVLPSFLQSSPVEAEKGTQWLLDWSRPLTSIVTGAWALTRVRGATDIRVVLSPTKEALSELLAIEVPPGGGIVLSPRYLVAFLRTRGQSLQIESFWRIFSAHAWLTLQFRYLVFKGPVSIVIKGCRGVNAERPGIGRLVNQNSTIGFTASTLYSTVRCETFMSYLLGEEALFNDRFAGDGYYIYEPRPGARVGGGGVARSFEAIPEAILKAFGI